MDRSKLNYSNIDTHFPNPMINRTLIKNLNINKAELNGLSDEKYRLIDIS